MYRFNVGESYMFCDTIEFNCVELTIDSSKLFHLDEFNIIDNHYSITYSQVRNNMYIAGILDLSKTYGKLLYKCIPDDKRIPTFLITYCKHPTFDKSCRYLYVTFQFKHWENQHPHGIITNTIGNVEETKNIINAPTTVDSFPKTTYHSAWYLGVTLEEVSGELATTKYS